MPEDKILGIWTKDEFIDTIIYASITAVITFFLTFLYRYISKWLELKKW